MSEGSQDFIAQDVVVPITYSSVLDSEGCPAPSRLSQIVFDESVRYWAEHQLDVIAIAGEQSYREHSNTGQLLADHASENVSVIAFSHPGNRLLNTAYQAHFLARRLRLAKSVTVLGWAYHLGRVEQNLRANNFYPLLNVVAVDDLIDRRYNDDSQLVDAWLADTYGFTADWPTIKANGLRSLAEREKTTIKGQLLGRKGHAFKLATWARDAGRHDDLTPSGDAVMQTTEKPRWTRAAAALAGLVMTSKVS